MMKILIYSLLLIVALSEKAIANTDYFFVGCGLLVVEMEKGNSNIKAPIAVRCAGYLQGFSDLNMFYEGSKVNVPYFCIPQGTSLLEKAKVVTSYMQKNQEVFKQHEAIAVFSAYKEAFPCK